MSLWTAGLLLAGCLATQEEGGRDCVAVRGRRVLELGCGSFALPAAAAAHLGASRCAASDGEPATIEAADRNMRLNGLDVAAIHCEWKEAAPLGPEPWDLVLFADAVYTSANALQLAALVDGCLAAGGDALGSMVAFRTGHPEFFADMRRRGFVAKRLRAPALLEEAIDSGSILEPPADASLICGRPASSCVLVLWRRRRRRAEGWGSVAGEVPGHGAEAATESGEAAADGNREEEEEEEQEGEDESELVLAELAALQAGGPGQRSDEGWAEHVQRTQPLVRVGVW